MEFTEEELESLRELIIDMVGRDRYREFLEAYCDDMEYILSSTIPLRTVLRKLDLL